METQVPESNAEGAWQFAPELPVAELMQSFDELMNPELYERELLFCGSTTCCATGTCDDFTGPPIIVH